MNLFLRSELQLQGYLTSFLDHQTAQGGWSQILERLQAHVHGRHFSKSPQAETSQGLFFLATVNRVGFPGTSPWAEKTALNDTITKWKEVG